MWPTRYFAKRYWCRYWTNAVGPVRDNVRVVRALAYLPGARHAMPYRPGPQQVTVYSPGPQVAMAIGQ